MTHAPAPPEFSRPIEVERIPAKGTHAVIKAEPAELAAVARRLDLRELVSLTATVELKPLGRSGLVAVNGRLTAEVVQTCGVTLQPVPAHVEEAFQLTFGPPEAGLDDGEEIELSWEAEDPPDPIIDGAIDVGEVVVEHLALALDPFPRAPGAEFQPPAEAEDEAEPRPNPFAALASLRQKKP